MRLISDEEFLKKTEKYIDYGHVVYEEDLDTALAQTPTIDAEPVRHGHWTDKQIDWHKGETYCSVCGQEAGAEYGRYTYIKSKYCPYCGAKMDEKE